MTTAIRVRKTNLIKNLVKKFSKEFFYIIFFGANADEELWLPQKYRYSAIRKDIIQKLPYVVLECNINKPKQHCLVSALFCQVAMLEFVVLNEDY